MAIPLTNAPFTEGGLFLHGDANEISAALVTLETATDAAAAHEASTSNPHSVTKAQVGLGSVDNFAVASQVEAEAGAASNKFMTPERTAQAIAALAGGGSGITELTGDVTAGPGSGAEAATIANDAVTNAKAANMAEATIKGRADGAGTGDPTDLTPDQASTVLDAATDPFVRTSAVPGAGPITRTVFISIDGAGNVITTGFKAPIYVPFAGEIVACTVYSADPAITSGAIELDLHMAVRGSFPPVAASIVASDPPEIATGVIAHNTSLTGWTTTIPGDCFIRPEVISCSGFTAIVVALTVED